jgi:hypothetical protein
MIAFVAVALLGKPALADELAAIELDEVIVATAVVVGIDRVDRTLVLLGPEGEVIAIEVGHAARNFDQMRIGDEIEAKCYQSVAISIERAGGELSESAALGGELSESAALVAARAPEGGKPGAVVVETVEMSAEIKAMHSPRVGFGQRFALARPPPPTQFTLTAIAHQDHEARIPSSG